MTQKVYEDATVSDITKERTINGMRESIFQWETMLPQNSVLMGDTSLFEDEMFILGADANETLQFKSNVLCHIQHTIAHLEKVLPKNTRETELLASITASKIECSKTRDGDIILSHKPLDLRFHLLHDVYDKLWSMFKRTNPDLDGHVALLSFHSRLYTLLAQYATLDGEGYQGTMNKSLMHKLQSCVSTHTECFASPLNVDANTPSFYSAFPVVDRPFGSKGSFFAQDLHTFPSGSYEVNPPFIEELMYAMVLNVTCAIRNSDQNTPLRFCIFVPQWDDTPCVEYMKTLEQQRPSILYASYLLNKEHYSYLAGFHHLPDRSNRHIYYASTYVFVLQNEAMNRQWIAEHNGDEIGARESLRRLFDDIRK